MSDFVNFELAQKLKEKGFDWIKITTYNPKTKVRNNHLEPTISQVLKWLREKKKLHINIEIMRTNKYCFDICETHSCDFVFGFADNSLMAESYEEAALAGIEYTLDNLI